MHTVRTTEYLPELLSLVEEHAVEKVLIELAGDIQVWALDHGISMSESPRAMAVRRGSDQVGIVVLKSEYNETDIRNQEQTLCLRGWVRESQEVLHPRNLLRFLVLHELAHLLNSWDQEHEQHCNEWAFMRLGWLDNPSRPDAADGEALGDQTAGRPQSKQPRGP